MVANYQLKKMNILEVKINHLFFAMTFFIKKFNDVKLTELVFKIFFSESINKNIFQLNKSHLADPPFYSFEYKNEDIIGKIQNYFLFKYKHKSRFKEWRVK